MAPPGAWIDQPKPRRRGPIDQDQRTTHAKRRPVSARSDREDILTARLLAHVAPRERLAALEELGSKTLNLSLALRAIDDAVGCYAKDRELL